MKFYPTEISNIAGRFLDYMNNENIRNFDSLKQRVGSSVNLDFRDLIIFDEKMHIPPNGIGLSYIVSYQREGSGLPIEVRVNDIARTALVIVKAQEILPGYSQMFPGMLDPDLFGNIAQDKENRCAGLDWVIRELESLSKIER